MGYSYGHNPKTGYLALACDQCGKADGTARKCKCPHHYCQPPALCKTCRADDVIRAKLTLYHAEHCKPAAARARAHEEQRETLLKSGVPVRCSALGLKDGRVHVIFQTNAGELGYYMPAQAYDAIPLLANATPDDYRKHGQLEPAPAHYDYGAA